MCLSTGFTANPADAKEELTIRNFDVTVVISMDRQASGLPTGASEPVELDRKHVQSVMVQEKLFISLL